MSGVNESSTSKRPDSGSDSGQEVPPTRPPPEKRRRGRPRGNPTPLNLTQRRARNAELERGRRDEMNSTFQELRVTLSQGESVSRAEILKGAVSYIRSQENKPSLAAIRRQNGLIEEQIAILTRQIEERTTRQLEERTTSVK